MRDPSSLNNPGAVRIRQRCAEVGPVKGSTGPVAVKPLVAQMPSTECMGTRTIHN